jgi:16S rRNA C967 or C1407 C5-methylase (RsmB/RsmF family)
MSEKFCETHLFAFLSRFDRGSRPLDHALSEYLRSHRSIGSHDRRFIGDVAYSLIRWRALLDYLIGHQKPSWPLRYQLWRRLDSSALPADIPLHIRCGGSEWLFQELTFCYGQSRAAELCLILNEPAPLTVRVNLLKTSREALLVQWKKLYDVAPCEQARAGIRFGQRIALTSLPEFKQGLFEIQDEGSQLVAELVRPGPGDQLLDFCSGSGGKSLAIAPSMSGRGQIYLHDIRRSILQEAKRRFCRAGIQNAQFLPPDHPRLRSLQNKMDWVLADVPCSGSGTYRRNPDMKWKGTEEMLEQLVLKQQEIFSRATAFVRPGGRIVYATCSLFERENMQQVEFFLKNLPLELSAPPLITFPRKNGADGFFGAVFCKKAAYDTMA